METGLKLSEVEILRRTYIDEVVQFNPAAASISRDVDDVWLQLQSISNLSHIQSSL